MPFLWQTKRAGKSSAPVAYLMNSFLQVFRRDIISRWTPLPWAPIIAPVDRWHHCAITFSHLQMRALLTIFRINNHRLLSMSTQEPDSINDLENDCNWHGAWSYLAVCLLIIRKVVLQESRRGCNRRYGAAKKAIEFKGITRTRE